MKEKNLNKQIGELFNQSLNVCTPLQMLHKIREKMQTRGYQTFDAEDILNELGHLQSILNNINNQMLQINDTLKKS